MSKRRLWALLAVLALVLAACGGDSGTDTTEESTATTEGSTATTEGSTETTEGSTETTMSGGDCVIGMSWNNYQEERWAKWDEPAVIAAVEAAGCEYISSDAQSSNEQQITDVEQLITQGADALIILANDGVAIEPAVQSALEQGIPVIAYDRLIENEGAFYLTFDNVEVGRIQARAIVEAVPEGRYVFIKGDPGDANAEFLFGGQLEVLSEAAGCEVPREPDPDADCSILNVATQSTDGWKPENAQTNMEQILSDLNNEIDAVVASNDGTAGGAIAALTDQGLEGVIPVSGQDADQAALNRVALGTQTVTVWKDARDLGKAAGEIAVQLAQGTALADVNGAAPFETPGGNTMWSILLTPTPIQQDNLNLVVDGGWISLEDLCAGDATADICSG